MNEHEKDFVQALLNLTLIIEELAGHKGVAKPNHTLALLILGQGMEQIILSLENEQDREAQIKYLERMFSK